MKYDLVKIVFDGINFHIVESDDNVSYSIDKEDDKSKGRECPSKKNVQKKAK